MSSSSSDSDFSSSEFSPPKSYYPDTKELKWYKVQIVIIIYEYFTSNDIYDLIDKLEKLSFPQYNSIFIKKLITMAMDQKDWGKERASVLISAVSMDNFFTTDDIMTGFTLLLESIDDTLLDIPDATEKLALFLARAVNDDVLAPIHLNILGATFPALAHGNNIATIASKTIAMARSHAFSRHAGERLERCWGGSSDWALKDVKDKILNILTEFQYGGDLQEACRCIREIKMPFFHHEVVKKVLIMAMEKNESMMINLLQKCHTECIISETQMTKGFQRTKEVMDDLVLDIPKAAQMFDHYVSHAGKNCWLDVSEMENDSFA